MMSNPILVAHCVQGIIQAGCVSNSVPKAIGFFAAWGAAGALSLPPSSEALNALSRAVAALGYQLDSDRKNTIYSCVLLTGPLSAMVAVTFAGYKLYALSRFSLINGAICGVHASAMLVLSYANPGDELASLRTVLGRMSLFSSRWNLLEKNQITAIETASRTIASVALVTSGIALTVLLKNPILANGVAYAMAPVVNHVASIVLREMYICKKSDG